MDYPFAVYRRLQPAIGVRRRYGTQAVAIAAAAVVAVESKPTTGAWHCCCIAAAVVAAAIDRLVSTWTELVWVAVVAVIEWSCCCYSSVQVFG